MFVKKYYDVIRSSFDTLFKISVSFFAQIKSSYCSLRKMMRWYKLLFLGHRSLIKKITQTAVINALEYNVYHRCLCYFLIDGMGSHPVKKPPPPFVS